MAKSHRPVLWTVLLINATMFVVEATTGILASSTALLGDSLDMLGDAVTYGTSLYVLGGTVASKARVARFKGGIMLLTGLVIFGRALYRTTQPVLPEFEWMTAIGILALAMNTICLTLLWRFKDDDINMKSVWLCSRNDIIANTSVLGAAGLVFYFESPWPDLVVGFALTLLFTKSAFTVFAASRREMRAAMPDASRSPAAPS